MSSANQCVVRFLTADAFWNLAMAINVYMTLFKNYNAEQLRALEWKYHIMCYGTPFIVAITCLFIETEARGKIYGPAIVSYNLIPIPCAWNVRFTT